MDVYLDSFWRDSLIHCRFPYLWDLLNGDTLMLLMLEFLVISEDFKDMTNFLTLPQKYRKSDLSGVEKAT